MDSIMKGRRRQKYNRGRWEVLRERGQVPDRRPPADYNGDPIKDIMPGVLKGMGLADRMWERDLIEHWNEMVGDTVARNARPGRVDRRVLYVYVSNSVWLNELRRYSEKQILKNIQARFGNRIQALRIQLDPDAGRK